MNDFVRFMTLVAVANKQHICWTWNGAKSEDGYGYFRVCGKTVKAHRWIFELVVAKIEAGMVLRHKCDNPSCVNPAHLEPGTVLENVQDSTSRGRRADFRGQAHGGAKLTDVDAIMIRHRASLGEACRSIAKDYPVGNSQIERIVNRTKWRHLP